MIGTKASPLEAFKIYIAIKQHFATKRFNYFESGACIRATEEQLNDRNDRMYFINLSKEYLIGDLVTYYMSNVLAGRTHPSEMEDIIFKEHRAKMSRINYTFECDLRTLTSLGHGLKPLFRSTNGKLPVALQALHGKHIELDTICVIDALTQGNIMKCFDLEITDPLLWKDIRQRIIKYKDFIECDHKQLNKILNKYINE